jgi:beta-phosphoglucomutase-like phosphatase (HAD superfamily)
VTLRMLQGLVLDFDGVIVNSEPLHLRAFQEVLGEQGAGLSAQEYYDRYVGLDDAATFRAFASDRGLQAADGWVERAIATKTARMQALLRAGSPLFPGAAARIRELARTLPLAVASGALRHEIEQVLEDAALVNCFEAIVAAGDTLRGKPAPDPYTRAVELLARATGGPIDTRQVVAVEDTRQGLASARAARLRTIAVTTTHPAEAMREADVVIGTIRDVTLPLLESVIDGARSS